MMTSTADGSVMWSINQITDPSLSITSETAEAVDALGTTIATFNRGKAAEFTANNSIFDLGLLAAQNGTEVKEASGDAKVVCPKFDKIKVVSGKTIYPLKKTPVTPITRIYLLNGDETLGTVYKASTSATDTTFVYNEARNEITISSNISAGARLMAIYDYEEEQATYMTADAVNFPKAGKFVLEVLGIDVCDPTTQVYAYIVFPNAKLDANVDISFTTDGNHPFTIQAQQAYCDAEKILYSIVIPDEVEDEEEDK